MFQKIVICCFALLMFLSACKPTPPISEVTNTNVHLSPETVVDKLEWHDGDSGIINDQYGFILANVDAPEIKNNNTMTSTAPLCEKEELWGTKVKQIFQKMSPSDFEIHSIAGKTDDHQYLIYLRYKGKDFNFYGTKNNFLAEWPMDKNGMPISKKPTWCDEYTKPIKNRNPNLQFLCFSDLNRAYRLKKNAGKLVLNDEYCLSYRDLYREAGCINVDAYDYTKRVDCALHIPHNKREHYASLIERLQQ